MTESNSFYMAKNVLISISLFGVTVLVIFVAKCQKDDGQKVDPRQIQELKNEIAMKDLKVSKLEKNQIVLYEAIKEKDKEIIESKKKERKAAERVDQLEGKLKSATDCPDSVKIYIQIDSAYKQLVAIKNDRIKADSSSISARDKAMAGLDSINTNLQIEIGQVKQLDEIHVNLLKDCTKDGRRKFWRGLGTGAGIIAILALIL